MSDLQIDPDKTYAAKGSVLIEYRELKRRQANPDDIIAEVRKRVPFEFDSLLLWGPMRDVLLGISEELTDP